MGELTVESIRAAVKKLREDNVRPQRDAYTMLVHPLRDMLIRRRCDPVYCCVFGVGLAPYHREMYDQTFADYQGYGINGMES